MFFNINFIAGMIILFVPIVACVYAFLLMNSIFKEVMGTEKKIALKAALKITAPPAFASLINAFAVYAGSTLLNQIREPKLFDLVVIVIYTISIAVFFEKGPSLIRKHFLSK